MKITNDKLEFESGDIELFSPAMQKALALVSAPSAPESILISAFNSTVDAVLATLKRTTISDVTPLAEALAVEKDPGKRAQVEDLIDQAKQILDVKDEKDPAVSLNPTAEPAVQKTK